MDKEMKLFWVVWFIIFIVVPLMIFTHTPTPTYPVVNLNQPGLRIEQEGN